jgi:PST family polysaccharide transporter
MTAATLWSWLDQALGRGLTFGTSILLARLLTPADFGIVSFAMVLIGGLSLVQDLGATAALVHNRERPERLAGTALTLNLVAASLLFGALALLAPLINLGGQPGEATNVARALGVGILISAAGQVQVALVIRDLAFGRKLFLDIAPLAVSGATSISLALMGFGAWSLVWGYLARTITSTALLWGLASLRPLPRFDRAVVKELLSYGGHISIGTLVGFLAANGDNAIVGHQLGPSELGLYAVAFTIGSLPAVLVSVPASAPLFSAYCRLREDPVALRNTFRDTLSVVSAAATGIAVMLVIAAPGLVPTLLGEKWAGVIFPLQIIAVYGVAYALKQPYSALVKAMGRPDLDWKMGLFALVVLVPSMVFGTRFGIAGVATAQLVVGVATVPLVAAVGLNLLGLPAWSMIRVLWSPFVAAAVAVGAAIVSLDALARAGLNGSIGTISVALAAGLAYACLTLALNPRFARLALRAVRAVGG